MKKLTLSLVFILIFTAAAYADYRDSFKKEFLMSPWAGTESRVNACIECHTSASMNEDLKGIPASGGGAGISRTTWTARPATEAMWGTPP